MSSKLNDSISLHEGTAKEAIAAVHRYLLPHGLPEIEGYDFAVYYAPCDIAGGDLYAFQAFDDGNLGFVVADVSGHGPAAATVMAAFRGALAAFRVFGRPRERAAADLNAVVNEIGVPACFITALFVSLHPTTGAVYSGCCGHPPGLIRRASGAVELFDGPADPPLGVLVSVEAPMRMHQLLPGDTLILHTDGVTDAMSAAGVRFGEGGLWRAVLSAPVGTGAGEILASVQASLARHTRNAEIIDDQCVLVCSRRAVRPVQAG